jgi:predicted RNA-binding Zn-ribbon protein involved in translation (DUF1610 family)
MVDPTSPEWLAQATEEIKTKPCPACGAMLASIGWEYMATGGSLAGHTMKASVLHTLIARCSSCPAKIRVREE